MINIKEHRIGNLVMGVWEDFETGEEIKGLCRITSLCECGSLGEGDWDIMVESLHDEQREMYDEFEPIPLSEEWLVKMGFQNTTPDGWLALNICNEWTFLFWHKGVLELSVNRHAVVLSKITSVHQLQNLVHSLTGEELTVKN